MVDFEPNKRPLTPEVADEVGAGFGVSEDNRPSTNQQEEELPFALRREDDQEESQQTIFEVDHQHYRGRGGGDTQRRLGEVGDDDSRMKHVTDEYDPHSDAAMALTALSSGMRDLYRSSSNDTHSGFQGFAEQEVVTIDHGGSQRSQTERESMAPSDFDPPLRETQKTLTDASLCGREGARQQQQYQQQPQSFMQPLALQLPLSAAMTPSSSSSALNTSTLTVSESTSPNSAQDDLAPRDSVFTTQEQYASRAPGERIQSLSHMLEDRLSLASMRTEQGWDRLQLSNDKQQYYHEHHSRLSPPFHPDDSTVHYDRQLKERLSTPPTHSTALQREHDELRRHPWEFLQDGRPRQQQEQQDFQAHAQVLKHRQQTTVQQHYREHPSSSVQDDRAPPHWETQASSSPTIEPIAAVKPKRKYTKKSSLPQSMAKSYDYAADFHSKQQAVSNELLYSDRGLILKTQIPKKGRPISKHSTTSSQSTPTLASLGILPASHHYFTKTGAASSASSSTSSAMSGLVTAASTVGRYPSDSALNSYHSSSPQGAHPPAMTEQREGGSSQGVSPTGRRPGRPPSNPSLSRHTHSQSYSSPSPSSTVFPIPSSSRPRQSRPLSTPTTHEFDVHSARHTDRQSQQQDLDDSSSNRFAVYRDRSPTLSVATTASSSQLQSYRYQHQYSEQLQKRAPSSSSASSHQQYISSPINQFFSGDELEYQQVRGQEEEDDSGSHSGRRRRTANSPSSSFAATNMPPRLFEEGLPVQMNSLKRSSSGMQKSLSMDGYHSRPRDNRRRMSIGGGGAGTGNITGGGRRGSMSGYSYATAAAAAADGQFEDVNEEVGSSSNFYNDEEVFDDDELDAQRSRKRISGSDLDYSGVVDADTGGSSSVQRRVGHVSQLVHSSGSNINKTWQGSALGSERRRPRSLVLPRGRGESALPWSTSPRHDSGSVSGSGGSGSMVGIRPGGDGQRHLDIDDDEIDYREMMIMTPVIVPIPQPSLPTVPSTSSRSAATMMRGASTRGKSRGGHSMHSHARSLDISFTTVTSNRGPGGASHPSQRHHRAPLSPSSNLEHHLSQYDRYSPEDMLPEHGNVLSPSSSSLSNRRRDHGSSSSGSLISPPPFGDTFSSASGQGSPYQSTRTANQYHHRSSSNSGNTIFDTPTTTSAIVTRADILAREMSGMSSRGSSTPNASGSGRGRRGASHGRGHAYGYGRGRGHLKAAMVKRSMSKRGPGPHLKKHQILQQQLYQMQRDQQEMDLQMAIQHQRQQMEKEKKKGKEKEQKQAKLHGREKDREREQKEQQILHLQEQQRQPPASTLRHQHSQSLQLDQEFAPHAFQLAQQSQSHSQHQQQPQNQPQTGRPTKQRVLLRSESALAVLHGLHSPPLGASSPLSTFSQSQPQPVLPPSSSNNPNQQTPTISRRRQNQQQPILLRPVSLPSLTGASHSNYGSGHGHGSGGAGGGGSGLDPGGSPPYMMNHPPPGQPLFRSLHPYLVSPSSLVSVASNASNSSTSTGTTGTGVNLTNTAGRGRRRGRRGKGGGPGRGGEEEEDDGGGNGEEGDDYGEEDFPSITKSPHISYASSTTQPLIGSRRMISSPYAHSHRDGQERFSTHDQQYSQGHPQIHHHHPYQRPHQHSVSTSSISIHQQHQDQKRTGATMSRSSSRGGLSASSSGTTLVHSSPSFTSQASLHQHQRQHQHQHQQHRHSSSLPSLNYYQHQGTGMGMSSSNTSLSTSASISSLSTSPQHSLDSSQKQHHQQQRKMSNPSLSVHHHSHAQQNDPTRPPIHRMVSHDIQQPPTLSHKQPSTSTSSSDPYNTTNTTATPTPTPTSLSQQPQSQSPPHEESVERLTIRTPLGEVRRQE